MLKFQDLEETLELDRTEMASVTGGLATYTSPKTKTQQVEKVDAEDTLYKNHFSSWARIFYHG